MRVLTLNTGSSSLKTGLYHTGAPGAEIAEASASVAGLRDPATFAQALQRVLGEKITAPPDAVGHRVVAIGAPWPAPRRLDEVLFAKLQELVPGSPDHLPQALAVMAYTRQAFPDLPQIACSDSSFHRTLPPVARRVALPRELMAKLKIERCGFHGLSCESIVSALRSEDPAAAEGRLIIAHLGHGASLTACRHGHSCETTMGFTPLGGLPMSTRSGDLDPGVLVELLRRRPMSPEKLNSLLNHDSGLLGASGLSGDMKTLLESAEPAAAEAVELFVHQTRKYLGAMMGVLGGCDTLVFTGGIGENSAEIRRRITAGLEGWGMAVRVIPSDEDRMIARHTAQVLNQAS